MQLQADLKIDHLNIRREKAGEEDGPIAVDIKLIAVLSIDLLSGIFATPKGFEQLGSMWQQNGELATHEWDCLTMAREGSGLIVDFTTQIAERAMRFEAAKLNKIRLIPKPGRVVEFVARLQVNPNDEQLAQLAELLSQTLTVIVTQPQSALNLDPALPEQAPLQAAAGIAQQALDLAAQRAAQGVPEVSIADCQHDFGDEQQPLSECRKCRVPFATLYPALAKLETDRVSSILATDGSAANASAEISDDHDSTNGVVAGNEENAASAKSEAKSHPCDNGHEWSDDDGVNPVICVRCDVTYVPELGVDDVGELGDAP